MYMYLKYYELITNWSKDMVGKCNSQQFKDLNGLAENGAAPFSAKHSLEHAIFISSIPMKLASSLAIT